MYNVYRERFGGSKIVLYFLLWVQVVILFMIEFVVEF